MLGVHAAEDVGLDGGHGLPGLGILRVAYSMHERESGRDSVSLAMQMEMDMDMEKRTNRLAHGSQRRCVFVYLEGGIGEGREACAGAHLHISKHMRVHARRSLNGALQHARLVQASSLLTSRQLKQFPQHGQRSDADLLLALRRERRRRVRLGYEVSAPGPQRRRRVVLRLEDGHDLRQHRLVVVRVHQRHLAHRVQLRHLAVGGRLRAVARHLSRVRLLGCGGEVEVTTW